ncbi:MAG TPA: methyltransferase domain-containing protein [Pyrinomonadaceae bacterium]|nr:methyltransferase domain-containing protein [Pyrinomonadaceae bacterium]
MFDRFKQRSYELEHLDKGDYTPEEYEGCIVELQRVNRWLGDTRALRNSLLRDVEAEQLQTFSVLDVGAGSGELLRVIAEWSHQTTRTARLVGLELNERSAREIVAGSGKYPQISSVRGDAFRVPFADQQFEYVICSLFTHHFRDPQVVGLLQEMARVARRKIFVIDLHRNVVAYTFFTTIAKLFLHNRLIRADGALSILRSFTPDEFRNLGEKAQLKNLSVAEHFPSRLVLSAAPPSPSGRGLG